MAGVTVLPRSTWTTHPPKTAPTPLDGREVLGVAIHYTGSTRPLGDTPTLATTIRLLEAERRLHTDPEPAGRGWNDIAYQAAIDQAGRVFDLRGVGYRSAANGDQAVNRTWGAITFLLGVGDTPTPALLAAFAAWRRDVWLAAWPHATRVVGHRDLHQTDCPGDPTYRLIRSGTITGPNPGGGPVAPTDLTPAAVTAVAEAVTGRGALHPVRVADGTGEWKLPDGSDVITPTTAWARTLTLLAAQAAAISDLTATVTGLRGEVQDLARRIP